MEFGEHASISFSFTSAFASILLFLLVLYIGPGRIFGHARIEYCYSDQALTLNLKDKKKTSFPDFCKSIIPPCQLNPLIFNGHLQTMWTAVKGQDVPIFYQRRVFENEDPTYTGIFAVDFVVRPYDGSDPDLPPRTTHYTDEEFDTIGSEDTKPMLVLLHGLSGGSYELYLRHVVAPLINSSSPWEACVVNARGCAMSKVTTNVLFNARATWDVRHTVKWLRKTFPNRPLFGMGFSLGANILANYIAEEGVDCHLKTAVFLSSPWNLDLGSAALKRSLIGHELYLRVMGTNMKGLFNQHRDQILKNPKINAAAVEKAVYLYEFDREVQGPTWGYPTEGAYYRDASSTDAALAIRIPFLAIHARDDPIAADESLPRNEIQQTPYGVLCTTSLGGHLSWFELGGGRWFAKATTAFFQKMANEVDLDNMPAKLDEALEGRISRPKREPLVPVFDPTRRRLHIPAN